MKKICALLIALCSTILPQIAQAYDLSAIAQALENKNVRVITAKMATKGFEISAVEDPYAGGSIPKCMNCAFYTVHYTKKVELNDGSIKRITKKLPLELIGDSISEVKSVYPTGETDLNTLGLGPIVWE